MTPTRHAQCRHEPHYFAVFLADTKKPCPKRPGWGDRLAQRLGGIGVKPCRSCKKRQAWLNRLGERIAGIFKRQGGPNAGE